MNIGVIGINHKLADLSLREALARACQKLFGIFSTEHQPHRFLLLSTCNRTEVYFSSPHLSEAQSFVLQLLREEVAIEFDQKLYSFFQNDCFLHLCRVTSGLDSAVLAETEIQGQVKIAYEMCVNQGDLPTPLHYAFQKALKVGKTVRTQLPINTCMPSLENAILSIGTHHFEKNLSPRILFVGASHINGKVVDHFQRKGFANITICNRSDLEASIWAEKYNIEKLHWSHKQQWLDYDWIIFGTRSPQPLLLKHHVPRNRRLLIVDLSVPRNVAPEVEQLENVCLYNIDQINQTLQHRKETIQTLIGKAEQHVAQHCKRLVSSYQTKSMKDKQLTEICLNA